MPAFLTAVDVYLPEQRLTNEMLIERYPDWSVEKIADKTGIDSRRVAAEGEFVSDMTVAAAEKVLARAGREPAEIDFIILVTQSSDYLVPFTAATVQDRLGVPTTAGALDVNLACSGYPYVLGLVRGLIESGQCERLLLVTGDLYSRYTLDSDRSVATLFGDAATASLIEAGDDDAAGGRLATTCFGTDGSGRDFLKIPTSCMRGFTGTETTDARYPTLYMDGPEVFNFTLRVVPKHLKAFLAKAGIAKEDVDLFVFHQANAFMLQHLRRRLKVPEERFVLAMDQTGNTSSSTIPVALDQIWNRENRIRPGTTAVFTGFGTGYSWASILVRF